MALHWQNTLIDSRDHVGLAHWWASALGWAVIASDEDEALVAPSDLVGADLRTLPLAAVPTALVFVPTPDVKQGKNRLHLDLRPTRDSTQAAEVERLVSLGATFVDVGQGDVPWVVLADPEGNELCVLSDLPPVRERD